MGWMIESWTDVILATTLCDPDLYLLNMLYGYKTSSDIFEDLKVAERKNELFSTLHWRTGKPGMLQSMESWRIGHDLAIEHQRKDDQLFALRFIKDFPRKCHQICFPYPTFLPYPVLSLKQQSGCSVNPTRRDQIWWTLASGWVVTDCLHSIWNCAMRISQPVGTEQWAGRPWWSNSEPWHLKPWCQGKLVCGKENREPYGQKPRCLKGLKDLDC